MFSLPELDAALSLVHESFAGTPQYAWPLLAERCGAEVWVKHENHTPIGAFKVRGGLIYVERLRRERPHVRGIVSATRGNHGQSLAWAGRRYDVPVVVVGRSATAWRRTQRCAHSVRVWSSMATTSRWPATKRRGWQI